MSADGKIEPRVVAVEPDLPPVVFHGRELGGVEAADPLLRVGLTVGDFGHPHPPQPLPDTHVGPRRRPGRREVREVRKTRGGRTGGRIGRAAVARGSGCG